MKGQNRTSGWMCRCLSNQGASLMEMEGSVFVVCVCVCALSRCQPVNTHTFLHVFLQTCIPTRMHRHTQTVTKLRRRRRCGHILIYKTGFCIFCDHLSCKRDSGRLSETILIVKAGNRSRSVAQLREQHHALVVLRGILVSSPHNGIFCEIY